MGSYCTKRSKLGALYSSADAEKSYKDFEKRMLQMHMMKPVSVDD